MITFSEPTDDIVTVSVNDVPVGQIAFQNNFHVWTPGTLPYPDMQIPTSIAPRLDFVQHHLTWALTSQMKAHEAGKTPDTNTLHPVLRPYLTETELVTLIRHPLVKWLGNSPLLHAQVNGIVHIKTQLARNAFKDKRWLDYIYLHETYSHVVAFCEVAEEDISDSAYWNILGTIWLHIENVSQYYDDWLNIWTSSRPGRENVMSVQERRKLAKMKPNITIYRGVGHKDAVQGLSWSLDKKKADWFARRFTFGGRKPLVVTATVDKERVLAYFTSRNEHEIVVDPFECQIRSTEAV